MVNNFWKRLVLASIASTLLINGFLIEASACTVTIVGLRREFRRSNNVFIGEVVNVEGVRKDKLPSHLAENWDVLDKIMFRIKRSWKGKRTGIIDVFSNVACNCPNRVLKFEPGKEFVIFSDRGFADACSMRVFDTTDKAYSEHSRRDMGKLNDFWFRAWSRAYPF